MLLAARTFTNASIILTFINFFPAVLLDGGLILRMVLQRFVGDKATRVAIIVSAVLMFGMAVLGVLWFQPVLVYLAIVITYDNVQSERRGEVYASSAP